MGGEKRRNRLMETQRDKTAHKRTKGEIKDRTQM